MKSKITLIKLLEDSLVTCNGCDGKKEINYEYWTELYEIRTCNICNGSGKRLNTEIREFLEKYK